MTANSGDAKVMTIAAVNNGVGAGRLSVTATSDIDISASALLNLDGVGDAALNSSTGAIFVGNDAVNGAISIGVGGTRTVTIGGAGTTLDVNALGITVDGSTLSLDGTSDTNLTMSANDAGTKVLTIAATNIGAGVAQIAVTADGPVDVDGVGAVSINSSGAAVNIADDAINQAVNVATAGTRTVTLGSATATIDVNAAGITVDGTTLSLDSTDTTNFTMSANADGVTKTLALAATNAGAGGSANITVTAATILTLSGGTADIELGAGGGAVTVDSTTLSLDGTDSTNLTMSATDGATKTLTIAATNAGAGVADISISADGNVAFSATAGLTGVNLATGQQFQIASTQLGVSTVVEMEINSAGVGATMSDDTTANYYSRYTRLGPTSVVYNYRLAITTGTGVDADTISVRATDASFPIPVSNGSGKFVAACQVLTGTTYSPAWLEILQDSAPTDSKTILSFVAPGVWAVSTAYTVSGQIFYEAATAL